MSAVGKIHNKLVFGRRVEVLANHLASLIPAGARVLDIGCGSGDIAAAILARRPDVTIEGIDVLVRGDTAIPVTAFDGETIPFAEGAFTLAMMVDVLHHTDDPAALLKEAQRVSTRGVLLKDHFRDGWLAGPTLRLMDWFGNVAHGVRLPYNYLSHREWQAVWRDNGLRVEQMTERLGLYPRPVGWLFDRRLHFIARLASA